MATESWMLWLGLFIGIFFLSGCLVVAFLSWCSGDASTGLMLVVATVGTSTLVSCSHRLRVQK